MSHKIKLLTRILLAGIFFQLISTPAVFAEDRWVTDEFEIMMRSGASNKQRIIKQLKSGTKLELLQANDESGFSEVRLPSGDQGWVLTRYLRTTPTAKKRLPDLEGRLENSASQNRELRKEIDELKNEKQELQAELADLQGSNRSLQERVERITRLSSGTIQVDEENQLLKQQLTDIQSTVSALEVDNSRLASRSDREWFLVGGGVLVLGLLLGLVLPRISWKKKDSWSDF
ncbi:MAG: TIGR04211 family SH3 domain-containing protein [Gammaproteobacteria bacterium]